MGRQGEGKERKERKGGGAGMSKLPTFISLVPS